MITSREQTFILIKPDGVERRLVGEVLSRFEKRGFDIVRLMMITPTRESIDQHYSHDESWVRRLGEKSLAMYEEHGIDVATDFESPDALSIGKQVRKWLVDFMSSGNVVAAVVEGPHAVETVRKIVGATIPAKAELGTIRGDFSNDSTLIASHEKRVLRNIMHASDSLEEAQREIKLWFGN